MGTLGNYSTASLADKLNLGTSPDQMLPSEAYRNVTATPEYMVHMEGVDTSSSVENFQDYTQLFHFAYKMSRFTNPNAAGQLYASARVVIDDPVLVIPNAVFAPNIFTKLINGAPINTIRIVRLSNNGTVNTKIQEVVFTNNFIQTYEPRYDTLIISFRPESISLTIDGINQKGTMQGVNATAFNFSTGSTESPMGGGEGGEEGGEGGGEGGGESGGEEGAQD